MRSMRPLDQCRCNTLARESAVFRNRDAPMELVAGNELDAAQRDGRQQDRGLDVVSAGNPGCQTGRLIRPHVIKAKPSRSLRRWGVRVDRYNFQIDPIAELHETIVGPHARMLAALLRVHAERLTHIGNACRQGWRRDNDVIEL